VTDPPSAVYWPIHVDQPPNELVRYTSGGIATHTIVIDEDGLVRNGARRSRLTPAELRMLHHSLDDIKTWRRYTHHGSHPDQMTYSLTYHNRQAIRWDAIPADWKPVVDQLEKAGARAR
jgi:hypothetical protein